MESFAMARACLSAFPSRFSCVWERLPRMPISPLYAFHVAWSSRVYVTCWTHPLSLSLMGEKQGKVSPGIFRGASASSLDSCYWAHANASKEALLEDGSVAPKHSCSTVSFTDHNSESASSSPPSFPLWSLWEMRFILFVVVFSFLIKAGQGLMFPRLPLPLCDN